MKTIMLFTVLFLLLLMAACSTSKFGWNELADAKSTNSYNEDFDPLTLKDDDLVMPTAGDLEGASPKTENEIISVPTTVEIHNRELTSGFRVQLLATKDEVSARDERRKALFKFEEDVYLEFESSFYKLRVGDCLTRKEADILREKALRLGFNDPWIVPSQVYRETKKENDL